MKFNVVFFYNRRSSYVTLLRSLTMLKNLVSYVGLSQQPGILPLPKVKISKNKFGKTWKQKVLQENISSLQHMYFNTSH